MRWHICVAALAITACVWAEDKPAPSREVMEDRVPLLESERDAVREALQKITLELDTLRSKQATEQDVEKRNAELRRSQALNEMRALNQIRLNELTEQLRQTRKEQLQQAFGEECTLTLAEKEPLRAVSLVKVLNVAGRVMLQFRSTENGSLYTVDPQRIVMAQVTK